jgi:hypothetical protein
MGSPIEWLQGLFGSRSSSSTADNSTEVVGKIIFINSNDLDKSGQNPRPSHQFYLLDTSSSSQDKSESPTERPRASLGPRYILSDRVAKSGLGRSPEAGDHVCMRVDDRDGSASLIEVLSISLIEKTND